MSELFLQMLAILLVILGAWYFFFSQHRVIIIPGYRLDPLFSFIGAAIVQWIISQICLFASIKNLKRAGYQFKVWDIIPALFIAEIAVVTGIYSLLASVFLTVTSPFFLYLISKDI